MQPSRREVLHTEFERAAATFAERTRGRFDHMDVVGFSRVEKGASIVEVGAGTGNFLDLFHDVAGALVAVDLTPGMLREARVRFPEMSLVVGDGARLPLPSASFDLVATAQALHHVHEPLPTLKEMRRVVAAGGRVLVVDQAATESYEEAAFMNQLEAIRDPSHAMSRPPSAMRILVRAAGLEIVDERLVESRQSISTWMAPGEFPAERFDAVNDFIDRFGHETGMDFAKEGGEWAFTRRRIMILAERGDRGVD